MMFDISPYVLSLVIVLVVHLVMTESESQTLHGGTFIAMAGKDCVVLASDSRFSTPQSGTFMVGEFPRPIYSIGSRTLVASYGLDSDASAMMEIIREILINHDENDLEPEHVATVISDLLFKLRYICAPIVVGLSRAKHEPFLCSMDGLGAMTISKDFSISGTAADGLYAICEAYYRPNLEAEEVVALMEVCIREALQRDVLSGCKVQILTMAKEGIHKKTIDTADV
jgi:20S proteasome subunit beta 3